MTEQTRYPLSWPTGWKRTEHGRRTRANFGKVTRGRNADGTPRAWTTKSALTVSQAIERLRGELRRLYVADDWLLSTNVPTRLDGLPYSNSAEPKDPGAAVYFRMGPKRTPRVLACDKWDRVADNIAAIAGHIEAIRAQDRYGVGTLDQAFAGYTAIPQKTGGADWKAELGFKPDQAVVLEQVDARYRELARERHPDSGGTHEAMARLNEARAAARTELQA